MLDESSHLCRKMLDAGHLNVTISIYQRMWHDWVMYSTGNGLGQRLQAADKGLSELALFVQNHKLQ